MVGVYFKARKTENLVNFPRAKPKTLEIEICLLCQKIAVPPPWKLVFLEWYLKSDNFWKFLAIQSTKESETTSVCMCGFSHTAHTPLCLADSSLSDLILLGGRVAVTQRSRALTKCSPLLFSSSSIYQYQIWNPPKKKTEKGIEINKTII